MVARIGPAPASGNVDAHPRTNTYANVHAHTHTACSDLSSDDNAGSYPAPYTNTDAYPYAHGYSNRNAFSHPYGCSHSNAHPDAYTDAYSYPNTHTCAYRRSTYACPAYACPAHACPTYACPTHACPTHAYTDANPYAYTHTRAIGKACGQLECIVTKGPARAAVYPHRGDRPQGLRHQRW